MGHFPQDGKTFHPILLLQIVGKLVQTNNRSKPWPPNCFIEMLFTDQTDFNQIKCTTPPTLLILYRGVHFIFAGKCKMSEMLYITWSKVVGGITPTTVQKKSFDWEQKALLQN